MPNNIRNSRRWPKCTNHLSNGTRCKTKCDPKLPNYTAHRMCDSCVDNYSADALAIFETNQIVTDRRLYAERIDRMARAVTRAKNDLLFKGGE